MITLYTKPSCQPCNATKRALDKRGIPYVAHDVLEDEGAQEVVESLGYRTLPVVVHGDDHWCDFRPDLINRIEVPL